MISQQLSNDVISSNIGAISSFSIKASSKAFSILSDGLYSNKVVAIVREIGCNAVDAHKMVGKETLPIEVKLPNRIDSTFHIKDFGPGLSHEQIVGYWTDTTPPVYIGGLYNTYFESTKTDSNDFIGALGLGSKSPFSYVSNFIVESRQNGTCNVYSCFKDENGLPSVALLSSYETTEDNGMMIQLVVNPKDIAEFVNAAKTVFTYFEITPTVIGYQDFSPEKLSYTFSGDGWKLCKYERYTTDDYSQATKVIQGSIAYPIHRDILRMHDNITTDALSVLELPIHYFVNIGDVEVAASRESLSYDERTINKLIELMTQCAKGLHGIIQTRYDSCTSSWEAGIIRLSIKDPDTGSYNRMDKVYTQLDRNNPFKWDNKQIPENVTSHRSDDTSIRDYFYKQSGSHKLTFGGNHSYYIPIKQNLVVFVDIYSNTLTTYNDLLNKYKIDNNIGYHTKYNIMVIKQSPKKTNKPELDEVLSLFGSDVIIINVPKKAKSTSTTPKRIKTTKIATLISDTTSTLMDELDIDLLTDKFLYVNVDSKSNIYTPSGGRWYPSLTILSNAITKTVGLISNYGFLGICHLTKSQIKKANKNPNSINFFDYFDNNIVNMSLDNDIAKYVAETVTSHMHNTSRDYAISKYIKYQSKYNDIKPLQQSTFGKFAYTLCNDITQPNTVFNSNQDFMSMSALFHVGNHTAALRIKSILEEWENMKKQYPLLPSAMDSVHWTECPDGDCLHRKQLVTALANYFTLVDKT